MSSTESTPPASRAKRRALLVFFVFNIFVFGSLGVWQVQRLAWKIDLIERVNARVDAPAIPLPAPSAWPTLTRDNAEYQRVTLQGRYLPDQEVAVYASTELGAGYWVMTPLQLASAASSADDAGIVWVNRGYVPLEMRLPDNRPATATAPAQATVTGLLRMPDDDNLFLRANVPSEDRWYRRTPAEFSAARALPSLPTAPFFIDAAASPTDAEWPRAGMTQVQFRNNHLSYAMTWFVLAALNVAAFIFLLWFEPKLRGQRRTLLDD